MMSTWMSAQERMGTWHSQETYLKLNKCLLLAALGTPPGGVPMSHLGRMLCLSIPLQLAHWFFQTLCVLHFPTLMAGYFLKSGPPTTVGKEY